MMRHTKRMLAAGVAVAASAAALTGCSAGSDAATCENTIVNEDAKVVTMWAWYPEFEGIVDLFNNSHDDVQICWSNAGAGNDEYTKLTTAVQAGSGAPDVVMLESEVVQSYIPQDALVDLTEYGAGDVQSNYSEGAWADVSSGDATYAIPVDGGPVGMLYRQDILDQYGIPVPTTWEEYAAAAQALKDAGSTTLMTDFPGNGRAYQQALFAQAGSVPYTVDGTDVTVDLDDEASAKVMDYWSDLVQKGLVGTEDASTTDYNTHLVDGTYASVVAAAWLPGYLKGFEGADTDAVWRAAPVPQWEGAEPTQINIGGSAFAVTSQAEDKEAAATVAKEIFGTEEAWKIGIEKGALFPLWKPILESDYFANLEYDFFGGQQINKDVFLAAAAGYSGFTFSPFQNYAFDQLTEQQYAMVQGEKTADEALDDLQASLEKYATEQGFTSK
jgi:multiple sugar transport system substrate-binding protein